MRWVSLVILMLLCGSADAATAPCASTKALVGALIKDGNKVAADLILQTTEGPLPLRIFANPKNAKWIMISMRPDGSSCLMLAGEKWSPGRLPGTAS